jgi:ribosome biogenesis protein BMS1
MSAQPVVRETRRFNTLKVPKKLQAALPFASKPKMQKPQTNKTCAFLCLRCSSPTADEGTGLDMQKRAVVLEPEDKRALSLLQQATAIRKATEAKRKEKKAETKEKRRKKLEKSDEARGEREKTEKKAHFKRKGVEEKTNSMKRQKT